MGNEQSCKKNKMSMNTSIASNNSSSTAAVVLGMLSDVREKYHINPREIGHGHYGVVRKCQDRITKEWYAIKSIRKEKVKKLQLLKREVDLLLKVKHPNIIEVIEVFEDEKYLHIVTELCTGGELFDRIIAKTNSPEGHFSEKDAALLVQSILDAIAYCHDQNIVHRDLKPENFLYKTEDEKSEIKIIDFGLSRYDNDVDGGIMKTKVGTPYYVAPEVLSRKYTNACDMWSIGVITYILLCGYPPFYGDNDSEIFDSVRMGRYDYPSPEWDNIGELARNFIDSLLQKDSSKRLTAKQALEHPWIVQQSTTNTSSATNISNTSTRSQAYQSYMGMKKLKKAAFGFIAETMTQAEIGSLRERFNEIDTDGNGLLTLEELDTALMEGSFINTEFRDRISELRHSLELGNYDKLDWKEFLAATMDRNVALTEDRIRMAFKHFDTSKNNVLTISDLIQIFGSEAQAREIMGDVDLDKDGVISFKEFKNMLSSASFDMSGVE